MDFATFAADVHTLDTQHRLCARHPQGKRVFGDKADALIPIIQKYVEPKPTIDQVKASASYVDPKGRLLVKNLYDQVAWYQAQGMVGRDADMAKMLDLSFVKDHLDPVKK